MTLAGKQKLEIELKKLRSVDRPAVIKAIEEARAHGDLSENADYSAAKERQSFIQGRIGIIGGLLATAQVIDPKSITSTDKIVFGATVVLDDLNAEKRVTYQIVGQDEANVKDGKIGINSPIARGLIGNFDFDPADSKDV